MSTEQEQREDILNNIEKFGCHIVLLEDDGYLPGFAYTIGLYQRFNHPEIICFGLKNDVVGAILNHACDLIKEGQVLQVNKEYRGFLEGFAIQFLRVDKDYYQNYLGYGGWFYDNGFDFPALQLVWPDKQHLFPWQDGFNADWKFKQPLLDRNTDFKFYEERNVAAFTTKAVLEGKPILFAYHNEDGDWQFHSEEEPNLDNAKIVALEQITKRDPSVNEIYHLGFGGRAWRDSIDDIWQWESAPEEE